jgi:hypothetical protein
VRKVQVTRLAGQLDLKTRTMLTEIDVDNKDGTILPGAFVTVSIDLKVTPLVQAPVEALVLKGDKTLVALVDDKGKVHYRPVVVADDDGATVRFVSGVAAGDRLAMNLGNEVEDGAPVQVVGEAAK